MTLQRKCELKMTKMEVTRSAILPKKLDDIDHQLNTPRGLSVDNEGNIIVADMYNKSVKIFSKGGHYLSKLGREGSFTFPFHCVQYDKYLIVSDHEEHYIKVFDRNGIVFVQIWKNGGGE